VTQNRGDQLSAAAHFRGRGYPSRFVEVVLAEIGGVEGCAAIGGHESTSVPGCVLFRLNPAFLFIEQIHFLPYPPKQFSIVLQQVAGRGCAQLTGFERLYSATSGPSPYTGGRRKAAIQKKSPFNREL